MYLAKFILCSGLFYLAYMLLFEKERMNHFKRFYLLLSLALSFAIPLITIESKAEIVPVEAIYNFEPTEISAIPNQSTTFSPQPKEEPSSIPYLLFGAYIGITSFLLARFIKNMVSLGIKVKNGKKAAWQGITIILNAKESAAYSFMNYIFVSQADYENDKIHEGILQHELAHVKQKHSIDVILIELLQVFFWFNPLLYFYRKAIQINHEYLADESVIHHHQDINTYQLVLINYISTQSGLTLTSQFNYLTIKKRLTMMSKTNTTRATFGKQLLILPILALAVFLFSTKTEAQEVKNHVTKEAQKQTSGKTSELLMNNSFSAYPPTKEGLNEDDQKEYKALVDKYFGLRDGKHKNIKLAQIDVDRLEALYKGMNKEQQRKANIVFWSPPKPMEKKVPSETQLSKWANSKRFGIWIDGKRVENSKLKEYKTTDFSHYFVSTLTKLAYNYGKLDNEIGLMTNDKYEAYYENAIKNPKNSMVIRQGDFLSK
jgi:hypothetical protein